MGAFDIKHWLVVLLVVVLVFGTKRLKTVGSDLGDALKSFRKAMNSGEDSAVPPVAAAEEKPRPLEAPAVASADPRVQTR